jgi:hypothetical protein
MLGNWQIQNWPTPVIYVFTSKGVRSVQEFAIGNVELRAWTTFTAVAESVVETPATVSVVLNAWNNGGPTGNRTLTDNIGTANVVLQAWTTFLPISETITEPATGLVALQAWVDNQPNGNRTLLETINSTVALNSWTQ